MDESKEIKDNSSHNNLDVSIETAEAKECADTVKGKPSEITANEMGDKGRAVASFLEGCSHTLVPCMAYNELSSEASVLSGVAPILAPLYSLGSVGASKVLGGFSLMASRAFRGQRPVSDGFDHYCDMKYNTKALVLGAAAATAIFSLHAGVFSSDPVEKAVKNEPVSEHVVPEPASQM